MAFVSLVILTNIANATWARFVDVDDPNAEILLLLSSRNRYLAFALGVDVSVVAYAVIGFLRIAVAFAVCHMIGRAYSYQATGWFKRYLGFTDEAEMAFDRGFERGRRSCCSTRRHRRSIPIPRRKSRKACARSRSSARH